MGAIYGRCIYYVPWQISIIFLGLEVKGLIAAIFVQENCYLSMVLLSVEKRLVTSDKS